MRKSIVLISVGVLNLLHGMVHIIHFIQSLLLISYSVESGHETESWSDFIMHSPVFAFIWAFIGIVTLIIGIKDYKHHKKCNHKHTHSHE